MVVNITADFICKPIMLQMDNVNGLTHITDDLPQVAIMVSELHNSIYSNIGRNPRMLVEVLNIDNN